MIDTKPPGRQAYSAFITALGLDDHWDELPEHSRVAWFAVECRCARLPMVDEAESLDEIVAGILNPETSPRQRKRLRNVYKILTGESAPLGPMEHRADAAALVPPTLAQDLKFISNRDLIQRIQAGFESPAWRAICAKAWANGEPRQSTIPAEMEHLDRGMMIGGAVFEEGQDPTYLRSRLTPGGDPAAAPLFSHIIGFPSLHVRQKRVDAEVAMDRMTTIAVDMGEHPISGRYLVSEAALRMMEQGEVVELVREPGSYSIDAAPIGGPGILPSDLADKVRATLEGYLADLKASPGVILSNLEPEPPLKTITLSAEGRAYVDRMMTAMAEDIATGQPIRPPADFPSHGMGEDTGNLARLEADGILAPEDPKETAAAARAAGFTGDSCDGCGSFAIVRTGKCTTCQECGRTGGCG